MTRTRTDGPIRREVVVIGGGQAGLAVGYHLVQRKRDFTILEAYIAGRIAEFEPVAPSQTPAAAHAG